MVVIAVADAKQYDQLTAESIGPKVHAGLLLYEVLPKVPKHILPLLLTRLRCIDYPADFDAMQTKKGGRAKASPKLRPRMNM